MLIGVSDVESNVALHDLGRLNESWTGILSPDYDEKLVKEYVHEQFLENADHYASVYQNIPHWTNHLRIAARHFTLDPAGSPLVLDLGSGAGNTIFALHELFPNARVIATDLSVPLLRILKANLEKHADNFVCSIIHMNAEQIIFPNDQVDLVVGGSILHHLFEPDKTLRECHRVLKPGGAAVFFEPFEIGNQILALLLKQLISMNRRFFLIDRLSDETVAFFEVICNDFRYRKGDDKSDTFYRYMDDKWLFTRGYFERTARSIGFRDVAIEPLCEPNELFMSEINALLRIRFGTDFPPLPKWAVSVINEYEAHFSEGMRRELLMAACVVFQK